MSVPRAQARHGIGDPRRYHRIYEGSHLTIYKMGELLSPATVHGICPLLVVGKKILEAWRWQKDIPELIPLRVLTSSEPAATTVEQTDKQRTI